MIKNILRQRITNEALGNILHLFRPSDVIQD